MNDGPPVGAVSAPVKVPEVGALRLHASYQRCVRIHGYFR